MNKQTSLAGAFLVEVSRAYYNRIVSQPVPSRCGAFLCVPDFWTQTHCGVMR